jgi:hypothetical protein
MRIWRGTKGNMMTIAVWMTWREWALDWHYTGKGYLSFGIGPVWFEIYGPDGWGESMNSKWETWEERYPNG